MERFAMAEESEPELKLEIAHVLTIDVVAYSTLLIHEQSRVIAELTSLGGRRGSGGETSSEADSSPV